MLIRTSALSAVVMLVASGCYNPNFGEGGGFRCEKDQTCPDGYTCGADFICVKNGEAPPDMGPATDQTTPADGEPPPPLGWRCEATNEGLLGQDVISDSLGLTLNANTGAPWLAFHEDRSGTADKQLQILTATADAGWQKKGDRLAPEGTHATILAGGDQALVAYNGQFEETQGFAYANLEMPIAALLTAGMGLPMAGHYPTLLPLHDDRLLVTHMYEPKEPRPGAGSGLQSYLLTKDQPQAQVVHVPTDKYMTAGLFARVAFSADTGMLVFWGYAQDGTMELGIGEMPLNGDNPSPRWAMDFVKGTVGTFDNDALLGVGIVHTAGQGFLLAYPLKRDQETRLYLSQGDTKGEEIFPGGEPAPNVGNPALATPFENDALGLVFVDEGRGVHFSFRPEPEAEWTAPLKLTHPLRDGGRPELIALFSEPSDGDPPVPMPMHFLAAYPQNSGEVALTQIDCIPQ